MTHTTEITLPTYATAEVSIGHITDIDNDLLGSEACPELTRFDTTYGWIIGTWIIEAMPSTYLTDAGFSIELVRLLALADAAGAKYLDVDVDADIVPGLPHHEW